MFPRMMQDRSAADVARAAGGFVVLVLGLILAGGLQGLS